MKKHTMTPSVWTAVLLSLGLSAAYISPAHAHGTHAHDDVPQRSMATDPADAHAITRVLKATWERPDAPLRVDPVVVQGGVAIAGWFQGERGGRALLRKRMPGEAWEVTFCAGDALKDPQGLVGTGLNATQAQALSTALIEAEARLSGADRAQLASFEGVVKIQAGAAHGPATGHGH